MTVLAVFIMVVIVPVIIMSLALRALSRVLDLKHPWWTHFPALLLIDTILVLCVCKLLGFPYVGQMVSNRQAIEFGFYAIPVSLLILGLSVFVDELWARQEQHKSFNWMSLFDEAAIGFLIGKWVGVKAGPVGIISSSSRALKAEDIILRSNLHGVQIGLIASGIAVVLAVIVEAMRPHAPFQQSIAAEDTARLESEIAANTEEGKSWSYFETQNPIWMNWVVVGSTIYLLIRAYIIFASFPWSAVLMVVLAAAVTLLYGGLRVAVTPSQVKVKLGIWGVRLLSVPLVELAEARVHQFFPLKDFGGYGIRFNKHMKAFYFRGNRGVLLTNVEGKKYLVGSDHPEKLAAVIQTAMKMCGG